MIPLHQTPDGITFAIKLHPRAKKSAITGEIGDALKIAEATTLSIDRGHGAEVLVFDLP